jgi:hypothetical protein
MVVIAGEVPMTVGAAVLVDQLGRKVTVVTGLLLTGNSSQGAWQLTAEQQAVATAVTSVQVVLP